LHAPCSCARRRAGDAVSLLRRDGLEACAHAARLICPQSSGRLETPPELLRAHQRWRACEKKKYIGKFFYDNEILLKTTFFGRIRILIHSVRIWTSIRIRIPDYFLH
jgi:hypothetical protein